MDNKVRSITLMSYNSTGFSIDKIRFINNLLTILRYNNPILCGQEHFIQSGHKKKKQLIQKVSSAFPGYRCFATPAVKLSEEVMGGRAQGGLWICWPEYLDKYVRRIKSSHWRVQGIILILPEARLLIVNVYHPTDPKTINERDFDDTDLNEVFRAIDKIRESNGHDDRVSPKYTFFIILTDIQNVAVCIPYKITGKRIGILNGLGHECTKVLIIQRKSQNIQRKICDQIVLALISHRMVQSM